MFLMLQCPTVTDYVNLAPMGDMKQIIPRLNQTRGLIKKFSDTQKLIKLVQEGEVIMSHKVKFDEYLKSQVELMKIYVSSATNCPFRYNGFLSANGIDTTIMTTKQQWGTEIIMSRFILSSVYIGGALESIGKIFQQTVNSYDFGYSNSGIFTNNLQIAFRYFSESVDPLKRLYSVMEYMAKLFNPNTIEKHPELNPQVFKLFAQLLMANLAYIKLEKLRMLKQYKSCKQGAWNVYQKMKEIKQRLTRFSQLYQFLPNIVNFVNLGIVFYKAYALNFMLHENEQKKSEQQYGFIKKQFQVMILQNNVVADEILKLQQIAKKLPGQQDDNTVFANMLLDVMAKHAQSIKYKFQIDIHENKIQRPSLEQITVQIQHRNIWGTLDQF